LTKNARQALPLGRGRRAPAEPFLSGSTTMR
jgi:hypothetical protein